ncbi:hypothetical protein DL93DRAFT_2164022 [Clavulina sp. PMI_390]|nr:hypothetical protein DL93DRAFT_2164022 [Clavulina sp. PMI_390]
MSEQSLSSIAAHFAGPILCGTLICQLLTGVMLMQVQVYVRRFKNDSMLIKCLVTLVSALVVVITGLISYASYDQTILHFGEVQALYQADKSMMATVVYLSDTLGKGKATFEVFVNIWWSLSLATDILITTNLAIFFHFRRTGFTHTNDILSRLNRMTIQNGGIVSLWATLLIIFWTTRSDNVTFIFVIPFPALYAISLLSSLNSRHNTSNGIHWSDDTPWSNGTAVRRVTGINGLQSQIQVTRTVEEAPAAYQLNERDSSSHKGLDPRRISRAHGGGRIPSTHLVTMTQNDDSSPEDRDVDLESEIGKGDLELTSEELTVKLSAATVDSREGGP